MHAAPHSSGAPRPVRIPLFARVEASGTTMYAWNISDGGVYLKAPGLEAEEIPIGRALALSFDLPDGGPAIQVQAQVVWVDPTVRDHQGRSALGLGLRFDEIPEDFGGRIRRFVDSFRYRVSSLGFPDPALARTAFADLFLIEETVDAEALWDAARTGHVGLVLLGEAQGQAAALHALRGLVTSRDIERQPPILYCAQQPTPELEDLIARNGRIAYAHMPIERLELRSQVQRYVEAYVLAFENDLLTTELGRALDRLRRENEYLRSRAQLSARLDELVGESPAMREIHAMVERIAPFSTSVVITGETGTGKELVARAVHRLSPRAERPFVAQNCAALAENLLDGELFGHVRGAFTGATGDRPGLFEAADGGTVFLDEVGEMSPAMQAKLLRVLQDGEVRRIGETVSRRVDVRILCATHRDLESMVAEGTFREDLYYRLRSFVLFLPPLRERREDVPALALHFLGRLSERHGWQVQGFTAEAMQVLQSHDWPGNARELEHTVERLLVLCNEGAKIGADLVREALGQGRPGERGGALVAPERGQRSLSRAVEDYERQIILAELERAGGVIAGAARALGMDRTTLSRRLRRLGIRHDGEG